MRYLELSDPPRRADFDTGAWARIEALLKTWLQVLREENDAGDPETTARRRGQIAAIKELLSLPDEIRGPRHSDAAR